jgi:cobalt-zinc-cadmium efflux system outer membrane protein
MSTVCIRSLPPAARTAFLLGLLGFLVVGTSLPRLARGQPGPSQSIEIKEDYEIFHTGADSDVIVAQPGTTAELDLESCVRAALASNEAVQAERLRMGELRGKKYQALATGLPTLDAKGEWSRGRDPSYALDESFSSGDRMMLPSPLDTLLGDFSFLPAPEDIPAQTFWRASLNLSWIINPIKFLGALGAANQGMRRQELAIEAVEHRIAEQVIAAYQGVILAAERLAAFEADLAQREETLSIMRLQLELGMATPLDTLRAAVALANVRPDQRRAQAALRVAGADLNALMGRPADDPLTIRREQPIETEPIEVETALALALQRPDLQEVDIYTDLLRQNRKAQKAEMRPYLSLDGQYGYVGRRLDELDAKGHDFWRASIALNVPLFDGLLTKGLVKETDASIRRTETELTGQRRQVRVELLQLLADLEAGRSTLRSAQLNLEQAEEILAEMAMMLRLGTTDYLSVLEAEASRGLARSHLIEARYDVLTLTASLKRAIGISPLSSLRSVPGLVTAPAE